MHIRYKIFTLLMIMVLANYLGCKSSSEPNINNTTDDSQLIIDGWNMFFKQDYDSAIAIFKKAAAAAQSISERAKGKNGWGWSLAYKVKGQSSGSTDVTYQEASLRFTNAMDDDSTFLASYAGACLVYNVRNEYSNSVDKGEYVIRKQPSYEFKPLAGEDALVDSWLIHLTVAESAFYLGNYNKVVIHLDIIDAGHAHDAADPEGLLARIQALVNQ